MSFLVTDSPSDFCRFQNHAKPSQSSNPPVPPNTPNKPTLEERTETVRSSSCPSFAEMEKETYLPRSKKAISSNMTPNGNSEDEREQTELDQFYENLFLHNALPLVPNLINPEKSSPNFPAAPPNTPDKLSLEEKKNIPNEELSKVAVKELVNRLLNSSPSCDEK